METSQKFFLLFSSAFILNAQVYCGDEWRSLTFSFTQGRFKLQKPNGLSPEAELWIKDLEQLEQNTTDPFDKSMIRAHIGRALGIANFNLEYEKNKFFNSIKKTDNRMT